MSVSDVRNLGQLDLLMPDRPAGRNVIGHAIDTIKALRVKVAELEAKIREQDAELWLARLREGVIGPENRR